MKKIKIILLIIISIILTGCMKNNSMEDITITTTAYPIKYVLDRLYGENSKIESIYPIDTEISKFKVTKTLLKQYNNTEMYIFNGLSNEKDYLKTLSKNNDNLKIIDVSSNMSLKYSDEEIWLDPNNLLTIANNIKKGFNEYITSSYLIEKINENYDLLKADLTTVDGNYYSIAKNSNYTTIIVSDDAFKYLEKYGLTVISLDSDTTTQKDISTAKDLLENGTCTKVFIKYKENSKNLADKLGDNIIFTELYTMTNLEDVDTSNTDYLTLINQNLNELKNEIYR